MCLRPHWFALSLSTVVLAACGSSGAKPSDTTDVAASTPVPSDPSSSAPKAADAGANDSPRKAKAKQVADALTDPAVVDDVRGRIAATGLGEADFGLPAGQLKALHAVSSNDVDPSQCATILGASLAETAKPAVEKRCGDMDALRKSVQKLPEGEKTAKVAATCKLSVPKDADASKINPWAFLFANVVGDELAADPATSDEEKVVAKALMHLCPAP